MPTLERLRAETKETVHLCVRRGRQAVFIERLPGERPHCSRSPSAARSRCTSVPPLAR